MGVEDATQGKIWVQTYCLVLGPRDLPGSVAAVVASSSDAAVERRTVAAGCGGDVSDADPGLPDSVVACAASASVEG